jgi:cytochrome P450
MTMLIAGHETSAAVLTWTFYLLTKVCDYQNWKPTDLFALVFI